MDDVRIKIFKYEVPVDGRWHEIELSGPPEAAVHHVGVQHPGVVAFWSPWTDHPAIGRTRLEFKVFGTGEEFPLRDHMYCGSAMDGVYVWHLISRLSEDK